MPILTPEQRALVLRMRAEHGIAPETTRSRIIAGWPVERLHEQPIKDPKRSAQTRRYTPACRPKPNHTWRRWNGPPELDKTRTRK